MKSASNNAIKYCNIFTDVLYGSCNCLPPSHNIKNSLRADVSFSLLLGYIKNSCKFDSFQNGKIWFNIERIPLIFATVTNKMAATEFILN